MDKSVQALKKADYYANKAAGIGRGGISSDDPEAITKLRAELAGMQASQDTVKAAHKTPEVQIAALLALGLSEPNTAEVIKADFTGRVGSAGYALYNKSGNMRRVELRITQLEANQERAFKEEAGAGYTYRGGHR